jgi:hypothetical protein
MSEYLWFGLGLFNGVAGCMVFNAFFKNSFSKGGIVPKQPEEDNEHNLPKGCELVQMGDMYAFKIKGKFAGMNHKDYYLWSISTYVQQYCITKDKQFAIKRGIETFEFFKALGKI